MKTIDISAEPQDFYFLDPGEALDAAPAPILLYIKVKVHTVNGAKVTTKVDITVHFYDSVRFKMRCKCMNHIWFNFVSFFGIFPCLIPMLEATAAPAPTPPK
jgi:hypothetical protein